MTKGKDKDQLDTLGGRLRAVRLAMNMQAGTTAEELELSRTTYAQYENGTVKKPDVSKLLKFTKITDISLDWLIERKGADPVVLKHPVTTMPGPRLAVNAETATGARIQAIATLIAELVADERADERRRTIDQLVKRLNTEGGGDEPTA